MRSTEGRDFFRQFLRSEYSEENLLFWLACEELKKETNPSVIDEKARNIYEDYVSILSPKEVRNQTQSSSFPLLLFYCLNYSFVHPHPAQAAHIFIAIVTFAIMEAVIYTSYLRPPPSGSSRTFKVGSPVAMLEVHINSPLLTPRLGGVVFTGALVLNDSRPPLPRPPHVCVGLFRVLWLPPTVQKHAHN